MSQAEADRFVRDMKTSTELQAEVKAKGGAIDEIIRISTARGRSVAEEEVRASIISQTTVLTEDEEDSLISEGGFQGTWGKKRDPSRMASPVGSGRTFLGCGGYRREFAFYWVYLSKQGYTGNSVCAHRGMKNGADRPNL